MKLGPLIGQTLLLEATKANDFADMLAAASDPEIWRMHPEPTRHQEPVFRKFFESALAGGLSYTVREKATGQGSRASHVIFGVKETPEQNQ